jgi:hypothetical protein
MTGLYIGLATLAGLLLLIWALAARRRRRYASMTPLERAKAASRSAAAETRQVTKHNLRGEGSGDKQGDVRWDGHSSAGASSSLD